MGQGRRSHGSRSKVRWVKPGLKVMILAGGLTPTSSCIFFLCRIGYQNICTNIKLILNHKSNKSVIVFQFSPMVRGDKRYLMSTGGDGCVCFWAYNLNTNKFK